ncbi:MAG: PAS domain S-box protein, partial [Acidobacteria bacterium]|nr:PAS domain S-box protein [Acidobacteriota bacterium]
MPTSIHPQLRWHNRLEARVVAGVILLVALSLAGVLLAATRVVTRSAVNRASGDLGDARAAFDRLIEERAANAAAQTRLILALPVFRATIASRDIPTVSEMANGYRQDLGARFAILTNPAGGIVAAPGWSAPLEPSPSLLAMIARAREASQREIVLVQDQLFLVISEPVKFAEELLGTITFGFPLDDRVAQQLAQVTHSEVNLVSSRSLIGSSLPAAERQALSTALTETDLAALRGISSEVRTLGGRRFIEGVFPLLHDRTSDDIGWLVLLQDWAPTQQFLDELRRSLLLAGIAAFLLALGGGLVFSRRTTRPLIDIADAARAIAAGEWNRRIPVRGTAEAASMAEAFNEMTRSLRDSAERLKASYQRFHTVTQSARDPIISTDELGNVTFWNRSAEATFGYEEAEMLGQPIATLVGDADRRSYLEALPTPISEDPAFGRTIEVTGVRKDGGIFPTEFSLAAVHGPQGTAFTAVVRDLTERKQAQEALRQRDEQLRQSQKMEAIGRLAGGVAHDFNNLLMAIRGYAELLTQTLEEGDQRREDAEEILKAADRAAGLTRQFLAFSRRQVITQRAVALDQTVENMQNMLQRLIGEDITMSTEIWPGLLPVLADSSQVEQIIVNLVVNARDAMADGGKITMELRNIELDHVGVVAHPGLQPGDYVEMSISDTGSGMDSETLSHVFEPFFATKDAGKGTGLGLATVYGIVQQNGGAIEVQSRLGHGTTFCIYLPRATDFGTAAAPRPALMTDGSETILLVEDDDRVRVLVANMLKKHGYTVLLASQGDQALEIAARHRGKIHLLVTDVVMPGINGRLLSERLATTRPDTRVLYMSGYSNDAILRHGVKSATTHFIQKPFSIEGLAQKVREALCDVPPPSVAASFRVRRLLSPSSSSPSIAERTRRGSARRAPSSAAPRCTRA